MTDIKLNEEQRDFVAAFRAWLQKPNSQYFLLTGWAGTGKTYAAMEALKGYPINKVFAAPTHKAKQVLIDRALKASVTGPGSTLASLLRLRVGYNNKGEERLESMGMPTSSGGKRKLLLNQRTELLVVDEASMVSKEMWGELTEAVTRYPNLKVLLMGDPYQLPPPKESGSEAFNLMLPPRFKSTLNKVERNNGAIGDNSREIVNRIVSRGDRFSDWNGGANVTLYDSPSDWESLALETFRQTKEAPSHARMLAWTNKEVTRLNDFIRGGLSKGSTTLPMYLPGELLTAKGRVVDPTVEQESSNNYGVILSSTQICKVKSVTPKMLTFEPRVAREIGPITVQGLELALMDDYGFIGFAHAALRHEYSKLTPYTSKLKAAIATKVGRKGVKNHAWGEYYGCLGKFGVFKAGKEFSPNLRPAFAQTIHQSQGSTYETVFLNARDVGGCKAKTLHNKLLYVGASRASTALHVLV